MMRRAFLVYAVVAWVIGLVLFAWGPAWYGVNLPGLPFYKASLIRVAGGVIIAAGCFAAALNGVEDSDLQRRGFIWFGIGHIILTAVMRSQRATIWESPLADPIMFVESDQRQDL